VTTRGKLIRVSVNDRVPADAPSEVTRQDPSDLHIQIRYVIGTVNVQLNHPFGYRSVMDEQDISVTTRRSKVNWRALDGMRAFAVLIVMVYHTGIAHVAPGGLLGVDVFFVLSGFLITTLLIGEAEYSGGLVDLSAFYARRALRLFPALAYVIVFSVALVVGLGRMSSFRHETLSWLPFTVFDSGNWALPFIMAPWGF
jgi:hypothetical protein